MKMISNLSRRQFLGATVAGALAGIPALSAVAKTKPTRTVGEVIDLILRHIPGGRLEHTVDTLKTGDPDQPVTGIVSTMFPTVDVIKKTIALGANLIIVHEPAFFNHADDISWLGDDPVYLQKRKLIDDNGIAIWRFHDYWHRHEPDGVLLGVLRELGWEHLYNKARPPLVEIPSMSLGEVARHVKERLGIGHVRMIGHRDATCRRIGLLPGATGGTSHLELLREAEPDVLICGEVREWETSEYVRDARALGLNRSLIVLGHVQSEAPGMRLLVQWLQPKVQGLPINHVPSESPFTWV